MQITTNSQLFLQILRLHEKPMPQKACSKPPSNHPVEKVIFLEAVMIKNSSFHILKIKYVESDFKVQ